MPIQKYTILTQSKPGREDDHRRWYVEHHLPDVKSFPGVVDATLHEIGLQRDYGLNPPKYTFLAIYDLDSDDPRATLDELATHLQGLNSPMTDAMDFTSVIEVVGRQIA